MVLFRLILSLLLFSDKNRLSVVFLLKMTIDSNRNLKSTCATVNLPGKSERIFSLSKEMNLTSRKRQKTIK